MSQRNSASAVSLRDSIAASATNEAYGAIIAHYAKDGTVDPNDLSVDTKGSLDASRSTTEAGGAAHEPAARGIAETSPEPDESLEKQSRASNAAFGDDALEAECEARISKIKKVRNLLAVSSGALGIALLGTLVGLIFLAVTRNRGAPSPVAADAPRADVPIPVLRDTAVLAMKFEETSTTDPSIANVFADHSLYQSFYGVNYAGVEAPNCSAAGLQNLVARDVALLSRVTQRVRIVGNACSLVDRVLNAILDIKVNLAVVLNVRASEWSTDGAEVRRVLASYAPVLFDSVIIEQDDTPSTSYRAYAELEAFLKKREMHNVLIRLADATEKQPNPLQFATDPNATRNWVVSDKARLVYTNLVSPAETSEKARAMAVWVCGVAEYLDPQVAWFWSTAFDTDAGAKNGIFTADRKLKPAGLPRCADYA